MARRPLGLAVAALAVSALTACGSTAQVSVTPASATPKAPSVQPSVPTAAATNGTAAASGAEQLRKPTVGECLNELPEDTWRAVDCDSAHDAEVSAIVASTWNERDIAARAILRTWTCDETAASYLGGKPDATFFTSLPLPAAVDPRSDDRIVCLVFQLGTGEEGTVVRTSSPMHRRLADPQQLARLRVCLAYTNDGTSRVRCSAQHFAEAVTTVSVGNATAPYPGPAKALAKTRKLCAPHVKAYLGGVSRKDLKLGVWEPRSSDWEEGHRTATCFVNSKPAKLSKSVRNIKHQPLKEFE